MERTTNFLSELEAELEADFGSDREQNDEFELDNESDNEFEMESGSDNELELDNELDNEFEMESGPDNEFEMESGMDNEFELEYGDGSSRNYESRISQLFSRGSDSELEFDQELNQVIHEMEKEFFFKGLKKLAKKGLQRFKSIAGRTPLGQVINTATSLARGNIRNALRKAASLALRHGAGFIPGGAALSPIAARALNLEVGEDRESPVLKAKNLVRLAKNSYQTLAQQLDPRMANPATANAMAKAALQKAMSHIRHSRINNSGNRVVIKISEAAWSKVKNGGHLVIKVQ